MKDKSPVCGSLTPLLKTLNLLNVRMSYGKHTHFYFGSKVIQFDEARREYTHIHTLTISVFKTFSTTWNNTSVHSVLFHSSIVTWPQWRLSGLSVADKEANRKAAADLYIIASWRHHLTKEEEVQRKSLELCFSELTSFINIWVVCMARRWDSYHTMRPKYCIDKHRQKYCPLNRFLFIIGRPRCFKCFRRRQEDGQENIDHFNPYKITSSVITFILHKNGTCYVISDFICTVNVLIIAWKILVNFCTSSVNGSYIRHLISHLTNK